MKDRKRFVTMAGLVCMGCAAPGFVGSIALLFNSYAGIVETAVTPTAENLGSSLSLAMWGIGAAMVLGPLGFVLTITGLLMRR